MKILEVLLPFYSGFSTIQQKFSSIWILLIIIVWFYSSLKFYRFDYYPCITKLKIANENLFEVNKRRSSPEEKRRSLLEDKLIGHYWKEFWETVVIYKDQNGKDRISNTYDAHHFFNEDNLINHQIDIRFYNALPGILTGLGILGTFLGLIIGLSNIDLVTNDSDKLREGIKGLLGGAAIAFSTSIWGITLSILFNWQEKWGIKKLTNQIGELQKQVDQLFDRKTTESWLAEIRHESAQQSYQLKKFNDDLAISIASALEEKLAEKLSPSLEKLFEAIEKLNNAGVKSIGESITKAAGNEFERIAEVMGNVGQALQNTANHSREMQIELEKSLTNSISNISDKIDDVVRNLASTAEGHSHTINSQIDHLNEITNETTEKVTKLVEGLADKFSTNMDQASQSLNEERESMNMVLDRVNESMTQMANLMEEAGLVADTFRESSYPIREAATFLKDQVREIGRLQGELIEVSQGNMASWNRSINKMEEIIAQLKNGLDETKNLWSGYEKHFTSLRKDLNAVFNSMSTSLVEYKKETGEGLSSYLQQFNQSMSDALSTFEGAIGSLSDVVEDLSNRDGDQ